MKTMIKLSELKVGDIFLWKEENTEYLYLVVFKHNDSIGSYIKLNVKLIKNSIIERVTLFMQENCTVELCGHMNIKECPHFEGEDK